MPAFNPNAFLDRLKKGAALQEVVAVDFSQAEPKCARLRAVNGGVQLAAADVLPPVQEHGGEAGSKDGRKPVELSKHLMSRSAILCLPGKNALVKLLSLPGHLDGGSEAKIRDDMGVSSGEYRIGYKDLGYSHGRVETKLLTVAMPEVDVQRYLGYFLSGWPVPVSIELAGLAAINAFVRGYLEHCSDKSLGVIQLEDDVSFFAFLHEKELVLIRKYDFGYNNILSAIQSRLSVNRETALNVAADQSFDISQMIKEVCDPFVRQLVISKHFVERRENCRVTRIFIPGHAAASRRLAQEVRVASESEIEEWDAFKGLVVQPEIVAPRLAGQNSLLAASIGAAVGFFEDNGK